MRWGLHVTLAAKWLDPAETEAFSTPFMVLYAVHDALVKPMPGGLNTPSLAESWQESVRFVLKEPWGDFMTFYGTTASGAAWIVPKKYVQQVGEDAFMTAPIGAGPYKVVSFKPGVEIVLEAFDGYWRKPPSVKRLVMRSMPEETTRAAALRNGEVDITYLLTGPTAETIRKAPGFKVVAPLLSGAFWLAEAGYPNGFDGGDFAPFPPYNSMGEAIQGYLQAVGIRTKMRSMERAAYFGAWREKKLHGVILVITAAFGNAATRLEPYVTKNGIYAYGSLPEVDDLYVRQGRELDPKKREALLGQVQKTLHDQVVNIPIHELAFIWGVGPRVDEGGADLIPGFAYSAPLEDLKLKAR
jgi:ABC-type transport system substrate-binding protein